MRHIFLTGFMGCGKTTLGRAAASSLALPFYDLDDELEHRSGLSIPSLFANGEAHFREVEHATLLTLLEQAPEPSLMSMGGGTWIQPAIRALVPADRVVFVDTPFEVLARRCANSTRPLATDAKAFRELYESRLPIYRTAKFVLAIPLDESLEESARRLAHLMQQTMVG